MMTARERLQQFVATLSRAGWVAEAHPDWERDAEMGIAIELTLERPRGELYATHPPDEPRVALAVVDREVGEYVELGFDYETAAQLGAALDALQARQAELTPRSLGEMLRSLLDLDLRVCWQHQEEVLDEVTPQTLAPEPYISPLVPR